MKILTAGSLAPYNVLFGFHVEDADGAFAVDGLAGAGVVIVIGGGEIVVVVFAFSSAGDGCIGED